MTKDELTSLLATEAGIGKKAAETFIEQLGQVVRSELILGNDVDVPDLGHFALTASPARTGHNPKTGAKISIPAGTSLHFHPTAKLKRALNP